MTKMKKISELDLSPHAFWVTQGALSENAKVTIENISLEYNYEGDLFQFLITLPFWVDLYNDNQRQRGRNKSLKTLYLKAKDSAKELQKNILFFSTPMLQQMNDECRKNNFLQIREFNDFLTFFINKCHFLAATTPRDIGGIKKGSLPIILISQLIEQYELNTKSEAKCGLSDDKGEYVGKFYQFMIALKPILAEMNIELGENSSIGQNARNLLTSRNKTRKNGLS